jgi:hypothetical protein
MKPVTRSIGLSLIVTLVLGAVPAGAQFEGIVRSRNRSADDWGKLQTFQMTIWIKGDKAKVQMTSTSGGPASTIISRGDRKLVWVLNDEARTYLEVRRIEDEKVPPDGETKPSVKRTGKTRKILGYVAEQIFLTAGEVETEIWGTHELQGLQQSLADGLAGRAPVSHGGRQSQLADLGLYPLIARTKLNGVLLESSEVTKIVRTAVSPNTFDLPPGYRRERAEREIR